MPEVTLLNGNFKGGRFTECLLLPARESFRFMGQDYWLPHKFRYSLKIPEITILCKAINFRHTVRYHKPGAIKTEYMVKDTVHHHSN